MVWWVDRPYKKYSDKMAIDKFCAVSDRLFQSVNIMFNIRNNIDADDIYCLLCNGVNIFNIDRTIQNENFYEYLKTALCEAVLMPRIRSSIYFRPVALSITMSVDDPVEVDERADFIVLKNIQNEEQVIEFKTKNMKLNVPVFFWISEGYMDALLKLIQLSDGIIFDFSDVSHGRSLKVAEMCKKYEKSLFYSKPNFFEDINNFDGRRKVLSVANEIVVGSMDGVVITFTKTEDFKNIVLNVTEALHLVERRRDLDKWFKTLRMRIKSPQLLPMTIMIATSLAAWKSDADAIVLLTTSGRSAQMLSALSPPCPIIAVTAHESIARRLHIFRNVIPLYYQRRRAVNWREECRNRVLFGSEFALKTGLFCGGAKLVVLAPSEEGAAYCDEFQIVIAPLQYAK